MTDRSFRYVSNRPTGFDYEEPDAPDFGTMEERNRLAQHAIRHDGLEPWKGLLFTVAPAAFVQMVEKHRDRIGG